MEFMYDDRISTKVPLSNNEVYSWLVKLDNSDDHKKIDFNYWIDYYREKDNINSQNNIYYRCAGVYPHTDSNIQKKVGFIWIY